VDRDFGPFFLKFSTASLQRQLCPHGHEYAKQQLAHKGIGFEALDNGVLSCDDPKRLQAICDGLSAEKIDSYCGSGCGCCRIPMRPGIARLATVTSFYPPGGVLADSGSGPAVTGRVFFEE
jgi:hypothetical protein